MPITPKELEWHLLTEDPNSLPWENQPIYHYRTLDLPGTIRGKIFCFSGSLPTRRRPSEGWVY